MKTEVINNTVVQLCIRSFVYRVLAVPMLECIMHAPLSGTKLTVAKKINKIYIPISSKAIFMI